MAIVGTPKLQVPTSLHFHFTRCNSYYNLVELKSYGLLPSNQSTYFLEYRPERVKMLGTYDTYIYTIFLFGGI